MSPAVLEEKAASAKTTLMLPLPKLQQALATVTLAVERKTTIPILASVMVDQADGHVAFSATNLDLAARFRVDLPEAKQAKPFLLPGLKLGDFAKLLQGDTVKITCHDERRATLQCGRSTTRLPLQSTASFPAITVRDGSAGIAIEQAAAERMLDFTSFAISTQESRYTLAGALLEVSGGKVSLVATDGHRLARYSLPTDAADQYDMLLPLGTVRAIEKILGAGDTPLTIDGDEQNVYANLAGNGFSIALSGRKMTAQFPNYKAVIPQSCSITLTVDAETILQTLRRCSTFTDERSGAVVLTINPDHMVIRGANAETGETDELLDITANAEFERFSIGFNVDYLIDAFTRLKGDVAMSFVKPEPGHGVLLTASPEESETFEYVIMPMRV